MTYQESKEGLTKLRDRVGEPVFRMAISHLMDVGIRNLLDDEIFNETVEGLRNQKDEGFMIMTPRFQIHLVETARELAGFDHIHLLCYITDELEYDVGSGRKFRPEPMSLATDAVEIYEELVDRTLRRNLYTVDKAVRYAFGFNEAHQDTDWEYEDVSYESAIARYIDEKEAKYDAD